MRDSASKSIGLLLFPALTQLDLTAPYEVFVRAPNTKVHLIWKTWTLLFPIVVWLYSQRPLLTHAHNWM